MALSLGTSSTLCTHSVIRFKPSVTVSKSRSTRLSSKAFPNNVVALFNPQDDPILKEAIKEPLAFWGGFFAGVFRLDLNEDPLREWVTRTSQAAGSTEEVEEEEEQEEAPEEIQIE